jgi:hypothetical protein
LRSPLGVGWRPELALLIERRTDLGFVEVLAENVDDDPRTAAALDRLRARGVAVVPHGVSLSLGSAARPERKRLARLAQLARRYAAPLVSEHLAFVRAGGIDSGHLLPLPYTRAALEVVVRNVRAAQDALPVPLALENIATLFAWPEAEMSEADFVAEVLDRTGAWLLLDVENLYANALNLGVDARGYLARLPLERIAYVHVAGGARGQEGLYHDTHAHAVPTGVLELLAALCARTTPPGVMLERDDRFPADAALHAELDAIRAVLGEGPTAAPRDPSQRPLATTARNDYKQPARTAHRQWASAKQRPRMTDHTGRHAEPAAARSTGAKQRPRMTDRTAIAKLP